MADGRGGFGLLAGLALWGAVAGCGSDTYPREPGPAGGRVWVFADSAVVEVATGPTEHRWRWNEPAADTLVALQYGWWARLDGPRRPLALGTFQNADPRAGIRTGGFSRLLRDARACVCVGPTGSGGRTADLRVAVDGFQDAQVVSRARNGRLHVVLKGRRTMESLFAGRPDSATVYRALPWPRVDSVRVPVAYEAGFVEQWNVEQGERPDGP